MRTVFFLFFSFVAAQSANAGFYKGNELLGFCDKRDSMVFGYVASLIDSRESETRWLFEQWASQEDKSRKDAYNEALNHGFGGMCIPEEIMLGQAVDVACDYLRSHPATRHEAGPVLIRRALAEAWPCGK